VVRALDGKTLAKVTHTTGPVKLVKMNK